MKVIFDHNVPRKLRTFLLQHEVSTAEEMKWQELENGDLIAAAENANFDVMVTCDKNIFYQQNLTGRSLSLVVLETNNWNILRLETALIAAAITRAKTGSFEHVALGLPLVGRPRGRKPA